MEPQSQVIPILLANGSVINAEVTDLGGEQDIAATIPSFTGITETIEEISRSLVESIKKVKPKKVTIEFGLELATESGKLTALLVKGTGKASLKISLEWSEDKERK